MSVLEGRYPARDRIWLGVNSVQLVSSAEPMDADRLRERVGLLAQHEPQLRWFSRPGDEPDRYRRAADPETAAAFAADMVHELPSAPGPGTPLRPGTPLEAAMSAVMDASDDRPVAAFYAGHGMIGHRFPHVFGDGLSSVTHLRRLLTGPEPGSKVPFPIPGVSRPLAHALKLRYLADGWMRAPGHVLADARMPRFSPPADPADPADVASDPSPPSVTSTDDGPSTVQIVIRQVDAAAMGAIKDWRKASGSGISTVSIQMAAIRRGLAEAGLIPADEGMYVAFDLRPSLKSTNTGGNFISVPYLQPDDPLDPISVHSAVQTANSSGLPLVVLMRGAARASLSRHTPLPQMRRPSSRRSVAFSHMRVGGVLSPRLLAAPDATPLVVAAAMPPGQGSLSFMLTEVGTQTTITAVFCSPFTPREPVEQVLDRLSKDPVGLLAG